jgi:hypothetical protein
MILKVLLNMKTKEFLYKWAVCEILYYEDEFQTINKLHLVHIDYQGFVKKNLSQTLYYCFDIDDDYLFLRSKTYILKVKPEAIRKIYPTPLFSWGDSVQEIERPEITGEIDNIIWHQKDQEFKYYIKVNGKVKSRRYSPNELKKL